MAERWRNGHSTLGSGAAENVTCSETWLEGATSLLEDMRSYADDDDEQAITDTGVAYMTPDEERLWWESDDAPSMRAHVDSVLRDNPPREQHDVGYFIEDHNLRLIGFWLIKVTCRDENHE